MATDMYLKIHEVKGESDDDSHKEEIEVLAWSWGMSQSGSTHSGGGGGSGRVAVQDISITKPVDSSSPQLLKNCCSGAHFKDAVLTVRKAGGKKPVEYLKIEMTDLIITSVSTGGSGGEDRLTENVSMNFAAFKVIYTPQKPDGSAGAAIPAQWDIKRNVEK